MARNSKATAERLPPHSLEAEKGVVGSIVLEPSCLQEVEERFGQDEVFYDLRHREIFLALCGLKREGIAIDAITLQQRLRDHQKLDSCGGAQYLSQLPDGIPSAANVGQYVGIVWDKYLARCLVQQAVAQVQSIYEWNGATEGLWGQIARQREEMEAKANRGTGTPRYLKRVSDFGEETWAEFFGGRTEEPGLLLPVHFAHKIRFGESTLVFGDDGCGKSTVLKYFVLHLAQQLAPGEKVTIASFEEPPALVLRMLITQLLGTRHLPDSTEGHRRLRSALGWLEKRFLIYNFLGIGDYRDVLDTFRYAAEKEGSKIEVVDNAMRLGIADDDYAQQAFCASAFANHTARCGTHLFHVLHENKGDNKGKQRIRGSKLWSANAWNVWEVRKNTDKGDKIANAVARIASERRQKDPDLDAIKEDEDKIEKLKDGWDTHIALRKQRFPFTHQNGSCFFYFDRETLQFRKEWSDTAVNWLGRWAPGGAAKAPAAREVEQQRRKEEDGPEVLTEGNEGNEAPTEGHDED